MHVPLIFRAEGALTEEREMPTTAKSVVIIIYTYKWQRLFVGPVRATPDSKPVEIRRVFGGHIERQKSISTWACHQGECLNQCHPYPDTQPFGGKISFRRWLRNWISTLLRAFLLGLWRSQGSRECLRRWIDLIGWHPRVVWIILLSSCAKSSPDGVFETWYLHECVWLAWVWLAKVSG